MPPKGRAPRALPFPRDEALRRVYPHGVAALLYREKAGLARRLFRVLKEHRSGDALCRFACRLILPASRFRAQCGWFPLFLGRIPPVVAPIFRCWRRGTPRVFPRSIPGGCLNRVAGMSISLALLRRVFRVHAQSRAFRAGTQGLGRRGGEAKARNGRGRSAGRRQGRAPSSRAARFSPTA